uniref:Uncharacterized protein n=1 Tax=Sinocyclocheilus grahami TaxID=75366 RepID=A0A672JXX0_SINGR
MRFNEKELVFLSRQPSERAAELGMRGPKKGDGKRRMQSRLSAEPHGTRENETAAVKINHRTRKRSVSESHGSVLLVLVLSC